MNLEQHEALNKKILDLCQSIRDSKRPVYTVSSADVLANFKRLADDLDLTPEKVAWVYFKKHLDAVLSYIKHPEKRGLDPEGIEGRFADAVNYLLIMYSIINEFPQVKVIAGELLTPKEFEERYGRP